MKLENKEKKLFTDEEDEKTTVELSVYKDYMRLAGNWSRALLTAFLIMTSIVLASVNDYWMGYISSQDDQLTRMSYYFGIFGAIMVVLITFEVLRECNRQLFGMSVSRKLHRTVLNRVIRAPINKFFDVTPVGRILNRFSRDISRVDHESHHSMHSLIFSNSWLFYQILLACMLNWWAILPLPILAFLAAKFMRFYQPANKEFSRVGSTSHSPVIQQLGEMVSGSSTIRAFKKEDVFNAKMKEKLDRSMSIDLVGRVSGSLFSVGLFHIAFLFLCAAGFLIVRFKDLWSTAVIGLVITYMMNITGTIRWVFWNQIWNEGILISFERLTNYTSIVQEAPNRIPEEDPKGNWPAHPTITYKDYWLKYRDDTDPVLKGLDFKIRAGEKVGIVGRTGAGKSTICLSLLRLVEPMKGQIEIDGVDITKIGLTTLREKITIIPQDPTLFKGTLRYNLDPLGKFTDEELFAMCERGKLDKIYQKEEGNGLDFEIKEGGSNLSSGEKQVLCICRALLQKSKIVVMDEATANIDHETEATIQELVTEGFKDATMLVVAHRINTIIGSDRVMFLKDGKVAEFENPQTLLADRTSLFYELVKELEKKGS